MKYVIIGGSAAGLNCAETIRSKDKTGDITVISDEELPLYSRCLISYYLSGEVEEKDLNFKPKDFFEKHNIKSMTGIRAEKIHEKEKKVMLDSGEEIDYDRLLIATGGSSKMPPIKGADKKGVFMMRTFDDIRAIESELKKTKTAAVLGGGLIGMRAAYALKSAGKNVVVVVRSNRVLSQMLDEGAAGIVRKLMEENGIRILTETDTTEILGDKNVTGLELDTGEVIKCEMVVVGKGVNPNIEITEGTAVRTDWGIIVDEHLQTDSPGIYAAGDVALTGDVSTGEQTVNALWPCAVEQGIITGLNMTGNERIYDGSLSMNSLVFYDIPIISMGITRPKSKDFEVLIKENKNRNLYKKIVLKDDRIVGLVLVNSVEQAGVYCKLIRNEVDISTIRSILLDENFNYAKILPLIKDNPEKFKDKEFSETVLSYKY